MRMMMMMMIIIIIINLFNGLTAESQLPSIKIMKCKKF
jgi:hypothetical protein